MKKQIVFVEYVPNMIHLKIAIALKQKKKYETVLISFSSIDRKFYKKAFDKIIILEMKHKINPKNLIYLFKKIISKECADFIKKVMKLNPYIFQITGPDLFTMIIMLITKRKPKIYFAYDIWAFYGKRFSLKNLQIKEFAQKTIEKFCTRRAKGILHTGPADELNLLNYKINAPDLTISPGCLDEWIYAPKNKKNKEIHLVFVGRPLESGGGKINFLEIIRTLAFQKIHFHTYGTCVNEKDNELYIKESKKNKYFHLHEKKRIDKLKKEIRNYDFGFLPGFFDDSLNPLWAKTSMANNLFDYFEAGLPVIINKQSEVMSKLVQENNIGFSINYKDLQNLKKIILKKDYKKMQINVRKAQKKFSMNKKIAPELERFYERVQ